MATDTDYDHSERALKRFWDKVNKDGPVPPHCPELGPCWVWTASLDRRGYGQIRCKDGAAWRLLLAPRYAYSSVYGPIPAGLCVLHRCDAPLCVRPVHLRLGTKLDNTRDMISKGRMRLPPVCYGDANKSHTNPEIMPRGERHGMAKLSDAEVEALRAAYRPGVVGSKAALAREYGISKVHVGRILNGQNRRPLAA